MTPFAAVNFDATAFYDSTALIDSIVETRIVPNSLIYRDQDQALSWLSLSAASPARRRDGGLPAYEDSFDFAASITSKGSNHELHVVGLAAGDGYKEELLCSHLSSDRSKRVAVTAVDSSPWLAALANHRFTVIDDVAAEPSLVADVGRVRRLPRSAGSVAVMTYFGILPGHEGEAMLANVVSLMAPGDLMVVSAYGVPTTGVNELVEEYATQETRQWLSDCSQLIGLPSSPEDFHVEAIEYASGGCLEIRVSLELAHPTSLRFRDSSASLAAGSLTLLRSTRHSEIAFIRLLEKQLLEVLSVQVADDNCELVAVTRKQ